MTKLFSGHTRRKFSVLIAGVAGLCIFSFYLMSVALAQTQTVDEAGTVFSYDPETATLFDAGGGAWTMKLKDIFPAKKDLVAGDFAGTMENVAHDGTAISIPEGYRTFINPSALTAYYNFDLTSGTTAYDTAGGFDGSVGGNNPAVYAAGGGKYSHAVNIVADMSRVRITSSSTSPLVIGTSDDFSIGMWIKKATNLAGSCWLFRFESGTNTYVYLYKEPGTGVLNFGVRDTSANSSNKTYSSIVADTWYHVVCVVRGTQQELYVNGSLVGSAVTKTTGTISAGASYLVIGNSGESSSEGWRGIIDDFFYYKRALSTAEISSIYTATRSLGGLSKSTPVELGMTGLKGYWGLEEGSGTVVNDGVSGNPAGTLADGATSSWYPSWTGGSRSGSKALRFDGTDDYVTLETSANTTLDNLPKLTLSCWAKIEDTTKVAFINKTKSGGHGWRFGASSNGAISFRRNGSTTNLAVKSYSGHLIANEWAHWAVTWDGTLNKSGTHIYKNGVDITDYASSTDGSGSVASEADRPVSLGSDPQDAGYPFHKGTLDQASIFDRVLSQEEIFSIVCARGKYTSTVADGGVAAPLWEKFQTTQGSIPYGKPLEKPPVAYWKLDGGSGLAQDSISGTSGTFNSARAAWVDTVPRQLVFDDSKSYRVTDDATNAPITVADSNDLDLTGSSYTISLWFKVAGSSDEGLLRKQNSYSLYTNAVNPLGRLQFSHGPDAAFAGTTGVTTNVWHHAAVTFDKSTLAIRLFLDGKFENGATASGALSANTNTLLLGSMGTFELLNGQEDDVAIYNRALSDEEVAELANGLKRPHAPTDNYEKNLAGLWHLDNDVRDSADVGHGSEQGYTNTRLAYVPGIFGPAGNFDGTDDYFDVPDSAVLDAASKNIAFGAWIRTTTGGRVIASKNDGSLGYEILLDASGYLKFQRDAFVVTDTTKVLTDGKWHHVMVVNNNGGVSNGVTIYADGVLVKSSGTSAYQTANTQALYIGKNAAGNYFAGQIDEVSVFVSPDANPALTAPQVLEIYKRGASRVKYQFSTGASSSVDSAWSGGGLSNTGGAETIYHFNTGDGADSVGSKTLSVAGATIDLSASGVLGKAVAFVSAGDRLEKNSAGNLAVPAAVGTPYGYAISMWVKHTTAGTIYSEINTSDNNKKIKIALGTGGTTNVTFSQQDDAANSVSLDTYDADGPVTYDGAWHHVVAVREATPQIFKVYVDGILRAKSGTMTVGSSTYSRVCVGSHCTGASGGNSEQYIGSLDDLAVWQRGLSGEEVAQLYQSGRYATKADGEFLHSLNKERYLKYRAIFETIDDSLTPDFQTAKVVLSGPLPSSSVLEMTAANMSYLTANFNGTDTGAVSYSLGQQGAANNYYWDGSVWVVEPITTTTPYHSTSTDTAIETTGYASLDDKLFTDTVLAQNGTVPLRARIVLHSPDLITNATFRSLNYIIHTAQIPAVTSPTGSDVWQAGRGHFVSWTSGGTWTPSDLVLEEASDGISFVATTPAMTGMGLNHNEERYTGAVSAYHFDGSGAISTGNTSASAIGANTLTASNVNTTGMTYVAGKFGAGAVSFDGVDDYFEKTSATGLPNNNGVFTLSVWAKPDATSTNTQSIVSLNGSVSGKEIYIRAHGAISDRVSVKVNNSPLSASLGIWHHIALVSDGTIMKEYIDGAISGVFPAVDVDAGAINTVYVGRNNSGSYFKGEVDEVALFNTALGPEQVQGLATSSYGCLYTTPSTAGSAWKVRVRSAGVPSAYAQSSAFTVADLAITSIAAQTWKVGSIHPIAWTASGAVPATLQMTYNIYGNYINTSFSTLGSPDASSAAAGTSPYSWTVPNTPSENVTVKIYSSGASTEFSSASPASGTYLNIADLNITSPNGSETWAVGSTQTVTWQATGAVLNDLILEYTTTGSFPSLTSCASPSASCTTIVSSQAAYSAFSADSISGLISWFKFDELSIGSTANVAQSFADSVTPPTGRTFSVINNPMSVAAGAPATGGTSANRGLVCGTAGVGTILSSGNLGITSLTTNAFSYGLWAKASAYENRSRLLTVDASADLVIEAAGNHSTINYGGRLINDTNWHHYLVTSDTTTLTLYVDGSPLFSGARVPSGNVATVEIGGWAGSYKFSGTVDELTVFDRALTQAEAYKLAKGGPGSYTWTLPGDLSTSVKVRARSASAPDLVDASNADFTMFNPVTVTYPNASGDTLRVGATGKSITWTASGAVGSNYLLQYSTVAGHAGGTWNTLTTIVDPTSTTSYLWNPIPNIPSSTVKVRLYKDATFNDESDADFAIAVPKLTFTAGHPSLNQVVPFDTDLSLEWTTDLANDGPFSGDLRMEYSTNGGGAWTTIVDGQADNNGNAVASPYVWHVPVGAVSNTVTVRITDKLTPFGTTTSPQFKVTGSMGVSSPNGGEKWAVGVPHQVTWTASGSANVDVFAYDAGVGPGVHVADIASNVDVNTGGIGVSWTPTAGMANTNLKIRMVKSDDSDVYDDSNNVFTLSKVAVGNPASRLKTGDPITVTWTHTGLTSVRLQYSILGDFTDVVDIITSTPAGVGSGSYNSTVPLKTATTFKIRALDASPQAFGPVGDQVAASDASDAASTVYGLLAVTAPTTGAAWSAGNAQVIAWTVTPANANIIASVKIELVDSGNNVTLIAASVDAHNGSAAGGQYTWIPEVTGNGLKVRVSDANDPSATGGQNKADSGSFTISGIGIMQPGAGATWTLGSPQLIQFGYTGSVPNVKIEYSADGSVWNYLPNGSFKANGSDSGWGSVPVFSGDSSTVSTFGALANFIQWTPPAGTIISGTNTAKVRITDLVGGAVATTSPFTMKGVLTMNTPSTLTVGESATISWTKLGTIPSVNVQFSPSGTFSGDIQTVATALSGTSTTWTVPDNIGNDGRLKVVGASAGQAPMEGISNAFSIKGDFTFTSPTNATEWAVSEVRTVTWTNTGSMPQAKLEYQYEADGGYTAWATVPGAASVSNTGATGSFVWGGLPDLVDYDGAHSPNPPAFEVQPTDGKRNVKFRLTDVSAGHTGSAQAMKAMTNPFIVKYYLVSYAVINADGTNLSELMVQDSKGWLVDAAPFLISPSSTKRFYKYSSSVSVTWSRASYGPTTEVVTVDQDKTVNIVLESENPTSFTVNLYAFYSEADDMMNLSLTLSKAGTVVTSALAGASSIKIYDTDGVTILHELTEETHDAKGVYQYGPFRPSVYGLRSGDSYQARCEILYNGISKVSIGTIAFTKPDIIYNVNLMQVYNESTKKLHLALNLSTAGNIVTGEALGASSIIIYDTDGASTLATLTQSSHDANGVYKFEGFDPGLYKMLLGNSYRTKCVIVYEGAERMTIGLITLADAGQIESIKQALGISADGTGSTNSITDKLAKIEQLAKNRGTGSVTAVSPESATPTGTPEGARPAEVLKSQGVDPRNPASRSEARQRLAEGAAAGANAPTPIAQAITPEMVGGQDPVAGKTREKVNEIKGKMDDLMMRIKDYETLKTIRKAQAGGVLGVVTPEKAEGDAMLKKGIEQSRTEAEKIAKELGIDLGSLMELSEQQKVNMLKEQFGDVKTMKDYVVRINAVMDAVKEAAGTEKPVVKDWMEHGSVILKLLAINPSKDKTQEVPMRAYLPVEARPEHVINKEDLNLLFDPDRSQFYAEKKVNLKPGETYVMQVHIEDIWVIQPEKLNRVAERADTALKLVKDTTTGDLAKLLRDNIIATLETIRTREADETLLPESHIAAYRNNLKMMEECEKDLSTLEALVLKTPFTNKNTASSTGGPSAPVGAFGSAAQTWKIILGIVAFLAALSFASFMVWERQIKDMVKPRDINMIPPETRAEVQKTLVTHALRDRLTNLFNVAHFKTLLAQEVEEIKTKPDKEVSLIMMDVDFFKKINDTFGHIAGDEVLKGVAEILRQNTRKTDAAFRYGGEEFVMMLSGAGLAEASKIAEKIRKTIEERVFILGEQRTPVRVTSSFGIAKYTASEDPQNLVARADKMLYQSKGNGRNQVSIDQS